MSLYLQKITCVVLQSTGINNKIQLNLYNKTVLIVMFTPLNENSDLETDLWTSSSIYTIFIEFSFLFIIFYSMISQ